MPIQNYGVWKAKPVSYTYETREQDPRSPHLTLLFRDDGPGKARAAINIKSGDRSDSRLVYWLVEDFQHPLVDRLRKLDSGFRLLEGNNNNNNNNEHHAGGGLALDYIRGNLFQKQTGRLLPHDIPGQNNDIIDVLEPVLDRAIARRATIYLYGSRFDDDNGSRGIHNVHMNQGSPKQWAGDNGAWQDGGLILRFDEETQNQDQDHESQDKGHWEAVFLGFASQAVHTEDPPSPRAGHPAPASGFRTWADFLDPSVPDRLRDEDELTDTPVVIGQAMVDPPTASNNQTVTLENRTAQDVSLAGWKVQNRAGQVEELPGDAGVPANGSTEFELPNCPLSSDGDVVTLLNAQGMKVHGVSYTRQQAKQAGGILAFSLADPPAAR